MNIPFRTLIALLSISLIFGCAQYRWEKYGATQQDFSRESYECQAEAARLYPAVFVSEQLVAGYKTPSTVSCNSTGGFGSTSTTCISNPGRSVQPIVYTSDANESNRDGAKNSCLEARGWRRVEVQKEQATMPERPPESKQASYASRGGTSQNGSYSIGELESFYNVKKQKIPERVSEKETIIGVSLVNNLFVLTYELSEFDAPNYTLADRRQDAQKLVKVACETGISRRHLERGGRWGYEYKSVGGGSVLDIVVTLEMCK